MKRIFIIALLAIGPVAFGQDAAIEERFNKLAGQLQDLTESKEMLRKQVDAQAKEIADLRDQQNKPNGSYASPEDVKRLADALQRSEKDRAADKEKLLAGMEDLAKQIATIAGKKPVAPIAHVDTPLPQDKPAGPEKGFEYVIQSGDTLSVIAKAYRDKNIKVSVDDILKANPGLKAEKLVVGKKIFIPAPQ